jgi:hypothetical protein
LKIKHRRPQDLWMRVALTVSGDVFNFDKVKETYDSLSMDTIHMQHLHYLIVD